MRTYLKDVGATKVGRIAENMTSKGCNEDKVNILQMVMDEMAKDKTEKPPNLRNIERSRLKKSVLEVNGVTDWFH